MSSEDNENINEESTIVFPEEKNEIVIKLDPETLKYLVVLEQIQERTIKRFMQWNQRFSLQQMLQLQDFIVRLADEIASRKQTSIKEQFQELKEVINELVRMVTPVAPPATIPSSPIKPEIKINISESDEEPS